MSSDWQDPFADDEAARERAARRAEREQRRRESEARESLGERVREELDRPTATPPESPPAEPPAAPVEPTGLPPDEPRAADPAPTAPQPALDAPAPVPPAEPPPPETGVYDVAAPPPPPRLSSRGTVARRRSAALIGVGVLIAAIAGGGAYLSHRNNNAAPAAEPSKARKTVEVVVPEGYDRTQIADVAKKAGLEGDYEEATASAKGYDLGDLGVDDSDSLEGLLFPATYEVYKGAKVKTLVKKQIDAFKQNAAGLDFSTAKDLGFSPYDVVIIASMIEREIAVPDERKLAASVIYNRLKDGTPLGIDATIRFEDHNYSGQLLESRLNEDTPYNTRINSGLPPGPIGNPGLASLEAAASPADTDFFYFVVKPGSCNEHTFVETQEEFDAAEAEYQAALQAEGGSPTEC